MLKNDIFENKAFNASQHCGYSLAKPSPSIAKLMKAAKRKLAVQ